MRLLPRSAGAVQVGLAPEHWLAVHQERRLGPVRRVLRGCLRFAVIQLLHLGLPDLVVAVNMEIIMVVVPGETAPRVQYWVHFL